jgi:hypothetical protein
MNIFICYITNKIVKILGLQENSCLKEPVLVIYCHITNDHQFFEVKKTNILLCSLFYKSGFEKILQREPCLLQFDRDLSWDDMNSWK